MKDDKYDLINVQKTEGDYCIKTQGQQSALTQETRDVYFLPRTLILQKQFNSETSGTIKFPTLKTEIVIVTKLPPTFRGKLEIPSIPYRWVLRGVSVEAPISSNLISRDRLRIER